MVTILHIYLNDIKNIITNWVALIIILALIVLPSLYAWFNIKASWDPYGNTKRVAVAVSNNDNGTILRGKKINVGNEVIRSLRENKKLGWTFVDEKTALDGVKHGRYYASITIPGDFSEKITSILNPNPVKPVITYHVNEKINAVAPKITTTGATGLVEEISKDFVKTASESIFSIFNKIGIELERDLPTIEKVKELIFKLEADIPEINRLVNKALDDADKAQSIVSDVQANIPKLQRIAENGIELTNNLSTFLTNSEDALQKLEPAIKEDLLTLSEIANHSQSVSSNNIEELATLKNSLQTGTSISNGLNKTLSQLDKIASTQKMSIINQNLSVIGDNFQKQANLVTEELNNREKGIPPSEARMQSMNHLAEISSNLLNTLLAEYDTRIGPNIKSSLNKAKDSIHDTTNILQQAVKDLPAIKKLLNNASEGITFGKNKIETVKEDLPSVEKKIKDTANRIRDFESKENIHEIINLLKHDVQKESDFFKEPVKLKEDKLFPIPNYGSAMSPFFTTLAFWVGAMLLISLLTVEVEQFEQLKSYQIYFGRLLTFLTIALLQSLLVTIGDIYLLHTYVAERLWFIIFGLLNSAVFIIIVYTLVSVFGNIGKSIGIVLLVLQISGSGGTFPIQVTPPFFQHINPYLPFTYAISLMREAVGGILWDVVQKDIWILVLTAILAIIIGVVLKRPINTKSIKFVKKAKESKLIH